MFLIDKNYITDDSGAEGFRNRLADDADIEKETSSENSCWHIHIYLTKFHDRAVNDRRNYSIQKNDI